MSEPESRPPRSPRSPRSDTERAVADRLHAAALRLLRRLRLEDTGELTPARASALSVVVFRGPLRLSELAEAERVRVPTMSKIAGALVALGLVTRRADGADGRAMLLVPTPKGRRVMQRGRERRLAAFVALLREVSGTELDELGQAAAILERVLASPSAPLVSAPGLRHNPAAGNVARP